MVILSLPILANSPATTFCSPWPRDITATTAVIPMKMPMIVSMLRSFRRRRFPRASKNNSATATIGFPPVSFYCFSEFQVKVFFQGELVGEEGDRYQYDDKQPVHSARGFQLQLAYFRVGVKLEFYCGFLFVLVVVRVPVGKDYGHDAAVSGSAYEQLVFNGF